MVRCRSGARSALPSGRRRRSRCVPAGSGDHRREQLEARDRFGERELDGRLVDDGRRHELRVLVHVVAVAIRPPIGVEIAEGEGDVVGGERCSVVPAHVVSHRHRPRPLVVGRRRARREPGFGVESALRPEQRVVDEHREVVAEGLGLRLEERIEVPFRGAQGDPEHGAFAARCGLGTGGGGLGFSSGRPQGCDRHRQEGCQQQADARPTPHAWAWYWSLSRDRSGLAIGVELHVRSCPQVRWPTGRLVWVPAADDRERRGRRVGENARCRGQWTCPRHRW